MGDGRPRDPDGNVLRNGDEIAIRVAVPDDAEPIARLHCAAALAGYVDIFPADAARPTPASLEGGWRALLDDPETVVLVAVRHQQLAGAVVLASDTNVPSGLLLKRLYVDPLHWGVGIGSFLHDRILGEARHRQAETVNLWVLEENVRARGMYERRGWHFVPGHVLANDPPEVIDVLYEKRLR